MQVKTQGSQTDLIRPVTLKLVAIVLLTGGCTTLPPTQVPIEQVSVAFERGDYAKTYRLGRYLANNSVATNRHLAAYLTGLSAKRLGRPNDTEQYLRLATTSPDRRLAADARAELGLLHAKARHHDQAAAELMRAARDLVGPDRANAYFYAAISQQKLGRWAQARTNLVLARAANDDPTFRHRIEEHMAVNGYTLQLGAFADHSNARQEAKRISQRALNLQLDAPRLIQGTDRANNPRTFVRIGSFATFDAARRARQRYGDSSAIIVPLAR